MRISDGQLTLHAPHLVALSIRSSVPPTLSPHPARTLPTYAPLTSSRHAEHGTRTPNMTIINELASVGMAVGPPLVYLDQYISIVRRRDSTGFSLDVCGVLIVANILRIFFWFGKRFEVALLVQSILCVASVSFFLNLACHLTLSACCACFPLA